MIVSALTALVASVTVEAVIFSAVIEPREPGVLLYKLLPFFLRTRPHRKCVFCFCLYLGTNTRIVGIPITGLGVGNQFGGKGQGGEEILT